MLNTVNNLLFKLHLRSGKSSEVTTSERREGDITYRVTTKNVTRTYAPSSPFESYHETIETKQLIPEKSRLSDGARSLEPRSSIVSSHMRLKNGIVLEAGQETPTAMRSRADLPSRVSFLNHGDAIRFKPSTPSPPEYGRPSPYTNQTYVYPNGKFIVSSSETHRGGPVAPAFADYCVAANDKVTALYLRAVPDNYAGPEAYRDATGECSDRHEGQFRRSFRSDKTTGHALDHGDSLTLRLKATSDSWHTCPAHCVTVTPPVSRRYFLDMQRGA
jgi:hypothetical protein